MTASELQDDLIKALNLLFKDTRFMTPLLGDDGHQVLSNPNIFGQSLPIRESDEQDDPFPYIIVRIDSGDMKGENPQHVKIRILIGIYDDGYDINGHKDVLNIIQKIYEQFAKNPVLEHKYVMKDDPQNPFIWALQDEDIYPYYYGAIEMTWETRAIRRESEFT